MTIVKALAAWFAVSFGFTALAVIVQIVLWDAADRHERSIARLEDADRRAVLAAADKIIADAHRARSLRHHPSQEYPDHHG